MRLLLITEVFPPRHGGSGRWFWEIYRRLEPSETTVLAGECEEGEGFDSESLTRDPSLVARCYFDLHRTPMSFSSWGVASRSGLTCYRRLTQRVNELIESCRPDQLHCGKVLPEGFVAWWLNRTRRVPYVCYVHGEELNIAAGSRELTWMTRRVFRSSRRVIANSHNTAELLRGDWGVNDSQLRVLHPGVDIERFRPADRNASVRARLGWGERPVVLTVGRLQKRKGQDRLIEALQNVRQRHPDILYSIVGDGPERGTLQALVAQLGLADHVDFRGELCDQEMLDCYQQCDLFALPNRTVDGDFEGFGMVLLEAQACGRPVVTGRSGGTGEAMRDGETGVRIDCESSERLADTIVSMLADRENLAAMGNTGRRWIEKNFGWEALREQALEVFQEMGDDRLGSDARTSTSSTRA